jgi:hypothetical protein
MRLTAALDNRPLARPLDVANDSADKPPRALCASDPKAWDIERDTPPTQVAKAETACMHCPLYLPCSRLLLSLPHNEIPWGSVMSAVRLSWERRHYAPFNTRWRRRLARRVERLERQRAAPES